MTLGPILPGRLPNTLQATRVRENLAQSQFLLSRIQEQISSGKRFSLPSQAPSDASRTITLQRLVERKSKSISNIQTDRAFLSTSESSLSGVSEALNSAKGLLVAGIGSSSSDSERQALADESESLVRRLTNIGNSQFNGRNLFGGYAATDEPFDFVQNGVVRYLGDDGEILSFVDSSVILTNSVSGAKAFGTLSEPVSQDIDPALSLDTRLDQLFAGRGLVPGSITVSIEDGGPVDTQIVNLSDAETIQDVVNLLEDAYSGSSVTLSVGIDSASQSGLEFTLSSATATITISDGGLGRTAALLGIDAGPSSSIVGSDLDPALSLRTRVDSLNGGLGIATGEILITNGGISGTVDLSTAETVEDVINQINTANLDVYARVNQAQNGIAISTRLSGAAFSIAESGATTAEDLGIRTMQTDTLLSDLNYGLGVSITSTAPLRITRRDGTQININLTGANSVQDVIDQINLFDPGNLVASFKTTGNGIQILDNSGTGPLSIDTSATAVALGINGTESGTDNTVPLSGRDVNPQEQKGSIHLLVLLGKALRANDDRVLERLVPLINRELERVNSVRGEIGINLKVLDDTENQVEEDTLIAQDQLSTIFDTDYASAITELASIQFALQATLQTAADTLRLSLVSFL